MITIEEINSMTDEEIRNMNAYLGKKVLKKFIILTAVKAAIVVGTIIVVDKILDKN